MKQASALKNLEQVITSYRGVSHNKKILPPILVIEPTNKCNINCIMCPTQKSYLQKGMMDYNLFTKIINQSKSWVKVILLYFRGEPLLNKNLYRMIQYAKKYTNARIVVSTNATLLTKEISKRLINSQLDDIIFTVDGMPSKKTFQSIKQGANYTVVLTNIKNFLSIKIKSESKINVVAKTLNLKNQKENEKFINIWKKLCCNVEITCFNSWANQVKRNDIFQNQHLQHLSSKRKPCADLWFKCVITYDGKVVLCCHDFKERKTIGDVKEQKIIDIWNNEKLNVIRRQHNSKNVSGKTLCASCKEWSEEYDEYSLFPEFQSMHLAGRP